MAPQDCNYCPQMLPIICCRPLKGLTLIKCFFFFCNDYFADEWHRHYISSRRFPHNRIHDDMVFVLPDETSWDPRESLQGTWRRPGRWGHQTISCFSTEVKLLNVSIQQLIRPLLQSSLFESHVEDARDTRSVNEGSARGNKKAILPITPRAPLDRILKDDRDESDLSSFILLAIPLVTTLN